MEQQVINIKHQANLGDLMASLSAIKHICEARNCKAVIMQELNVPARYYQGATHPIKNGEQMVMMNNKAFEMAKPLILAQDYIYDFVEYVGQTPIHYDLDKIRGEVFTNMPYNPIQRWLTYIFPDMQSDISKKWIEVPHNDQFNGFQEKIVINRTSRYNNDVINYFFLKEYTDKCVFIGVKDEYDYFTNRYDLSIPKVEIDNFLQLAQVINQCKVFIGNQSMAYNIAEGLKANRILELCPSAPNCTVTGANGNEFFHQYALEYYLKQYFL